MPSSEMKPGFVARGACHARPPSPPPAAPCDSPRPPYVPQAPPLVPKVGLWERKHRGEAPLRGGGWQKARRGTRHPPRNGIAPAIAFPKPHFGNEETFPRHPPTPAPRPAAKPAPAGKPLPPDHHFCFNHSTDARPSDPYAAKPPPPERAKRMLGPYPHRPL